MSADANAAAREEDGPLIDTTDWDEMLNLIDVGLEELRRKIENGRVRSPENEKVRVKQFRALFYGINIRRQVANDRDLQELTERVEELENLRSEGERP